MSDEISAAIVGGLIGVGGALVGSIVPLMWALRYDAYRRAVGEHREYLAWLRGLIPECEYILGCIDQIQPSYQTMVDGGPLICPTKRLNSDFFESARLAVMRHPRSTVLFPQLTAAYRDVVHTNDMMDRFEATYGGAFKSGNPRDALAGIVKPTAASLLGVRASVASLLEMVREQARVEAENQPALLSFVGWNFKP